MESLWVVQAYVALPLTKIKWCFSNQRLLFKLVFYGSFAPFRSFGFNSALKPIRDAVTIRLKNPAGELDIRDVLEDRVLCVSEKVVTIPQVINLGRELTGSRIRQFLI